MKKSFKHQKSDKSPALLILLAAAALLFALAAAVFLIDARHARFYFSGPQEVTIEYGETYTDPGVYAVSSGRLFGESKERLEISESISGDSDALGTYEIVYTAHCLFRDYTAVRRITVVDTVSPVITLNYIDGYKPSWFTGYEEEGFTAIDNADGDISGKVERREYDDRVEYTVSDSSGNTASAARPLDFSAYRPEIHLNGGEKMNVTASLEFTDPGFTAVDGSGSDVSEHVVVSGEVIPYLAGEYELHYDIYNKDGDAVSAVRNVTVVPVAKPETVRPEEKTIYLTFDDGPGQYTEELLDTLKKYDVKATFFVTNCYPGYRSMIGRAAQEGHSVGVHSLSHNYNSIYKSEQAYFNDFFAMQEIIKEQTGSYTKLFRFPGGSSNTVSSFNPGIMTRLTAAMTDLGYTYFDWNVSSGDAGETTKTDKVISNVKDGCKDKTISVVLQHDTKNFSVRAVEEIILWGQKNGYSFKALDETAPTSHHRIAN